MSITSIIIPSYNGIHLLMDCVFSIRQYTDTPYEIIVVDNGSTDGTTQFCINEGITFVSLPENTGFPIACNKGLNIARGDNLLLLNNDVLVSPRWLSNMLECLHSDEQIGIVGPYTNYASGKQQIAMPFSSLEDMTIQLNHSDREKWVQTDRLVGLCFLFKREVMDRIGLLDDSFSPGHYEDDDYCYRARLAGYKLMIAGDVFVFHHGSASFKRNNEDFVKQLIAINHQKFLDKWGIDPTMFITS